ncbi:hypothetical protein BDV98DRAFT_577753 [Pterulicium gracile]|uniref:Uncharacterized protein n=1 Tax=Pterulicium gracile TaxID=1884261 RepID=A0A5C3Q5G4_9AGAR|nr:hypothetical protein BDV98DRAFT_577753 [Pterula gracilis]
MSLLLLLVRRMVAALAFPRVFLPFFTSLGLACSRRVLLNLVPSKRFHRIRDIVDAMDEACVRIYEDR